jgi:hypothetical protein
MALPSLSEFQPVIAEITESLVGIVCGKNKADCLPAWTPEQWRYAKVVASIQGIAPLLHHAGAGANGSNEWRDFVVEQYRLNTLRNQRVFGLLDCVLAKTHAHGAQVMPLKGVVLARLLYTDEGLRPMSDIDLFAHTGQLASAQAAIEEAGFIFADRSDREISYVYPPNSVVSWIGEHPDNPIKLELHLRVANRLRQEDYDITRVIAQNGNAAYGGYPSWAAMMFHLLHHAAAHLSECGLRFIHLYDIHLLARRFSKQDWSALRDLLDRHDCLWWAHGPLALLQRYFPGDAPGWIMQASHAAAPERLRRASARWTITQVSYCNLSSRYVLQRMAWMRTNRSLLFYCASYLSDSASRFADRLLARLASNGRAETNAWGLYPVIHEPRRSFLRRASNVISSNAYRRGVVERFEHADTDGAANRTLNDERCAA